MEENDEQLFMDDLIEVFNKCILLKTATGNSSNISHSSIPHLKDIADISSLGRYIRWSLSCRKLAEIILSRQQKGNVHGHITWNDVLVLSEPFIPNKDSYLQIVNSIGHPDKHAMTLFGTNHAKDDDINHTLVSPTRQKKLSNFSRYVQSCNNEDSNHDINSTNINIIRMNDDNNNMMDKATNGIMMNGNDKDEIIHSNSNSSNSIHTNNNKSTNNSNSANNHSNSNNSNDTTNTNNSNSNTNNSSNKVRHIDSELSTYVDDDRQCDRASINPTITTSTSGSNTNTNIAPPTTTSTTTSSSMIDDPPPSYQFATGQLDVASTAKNNTNTSTHSNTTNSNTTNANTTSTTTTNNNYNTTVGDVSVGPINEDSLFDIDLNDDNDNDKNQQYHNNHSNHQPSSSSSSSSSPLPPLKPTTRIRSNSRSTSPTHSVHSLHSSYSSSPSSPTKQERGIAADSSATATTTAVSTSTSAVGRIGSFIKSVLSHSSSSGNLTRSRSQSLSSQSAPVTPVSSNQTTPPVTATTTTTTTTTGNDTHTATPLTINAATTTTTTTGNADTSITDFASLSPTQKQRLVSLSHVRDNTHVRQHSLSRSQNNSPTHHQQQQQQQKQERNLSSSSSQISIPLASSSSSCSPPHIHSTGNDEVEATQSKVLLPKTDTYNWNDDSIIPSHTTALPTHTSTNITNTTTTTMKNGTAINIARHMSDPVMYNHTATAHNPNNTTNTTTTGTAASPLPVKPPKPFMSRSVSDLTSRNHNLHHSFNTAAAADSSNSNSTNTANNANTMSMSLDSSHQQQLPRDLISSNTANNNNNNSSSSNNNMINCARSESNISFSSVGSRRSVRSVGSIKSEKSTNSYLSNASAKIIRLFGGGKHPDRHLFSSLDSFNPTQNQPPSLKQNQQLQQPVMDRSSNTATTTITGIASPVKGGVRGGDMAMRGVGIGMGGVMVSNNNDDNSSFYSHPQSEISGGMTGAGISMTGGSGGDNRTINDMNEYRRLKKDGRGIGRIVRQEVAKVLRLNHLLISHQNQISSSSSSSSLQILTNPATTTSTTDNNQVASTTVTEQSLPLMTDIQYQSTISTTAMTTMTTPYDRLQAACARAQQTSLFSSLLHLHSACGMKKDEDVRKGEKMKEEEEDIYVSIHTLNNNNNSNNNNNKIAVSSDVMELIKSIQQQVQQQQLQQQGAQSNIQQKAVQSNTVNNNNNSNNNNDDTVNNNNNSNNNNNDTNKSHENDPSSSSLVPGTWSYYYHRGATPLCLSTDTTRSRREELFHPHTLNRIIPSRNKYNHFLSQQQQQQQLLSMGSINSNSSNNNSNITPSSSSSSSLLLLPLSLHSLSQLSPRGGIPLPPIYSTLCSTDTGATGVSGLRSIEPYGRNSPSLRHSLSLPASSSSSSSSSSLILQQQQQQSDYDLVAGVAYHTAVMRKTSHGLFTQRNLVLFGQASLPSSSSSSSAVISHHHLSPRVCVYTSSLSSAWGQLPVGLKSCILVSDIMAVSVEDPKPYISFSSSNNSNNSRNLFMILASTYLRPPVVSAVSVVPTTSSGSSSGSAVNRGAADDESFVVSKGVMDSMVNQNDNDDDDDRITDIDKSMMTSASAMMIHNDGNTTQTNKKSQSVHLLLSAESAEKRLVWVQWLEGARNHIGSSSGSSSNDNHNNNNKNSNTTIVSS